MILSAVAVIGVLGMVLFVAGFVLERPELAMFGAIFIVGLGAAGMVDGYQVKTGEVQTTNETTGETVVENTYEEVEVHPRFPLDVVVILLGAVMLMSSSGAASETDLRDAEQKRPPWKRGD